MRIRKKIINLCSVYLMVFALLSCNNNDNIIPDNLIKINYQEIDDTAFEGIKGSSVAVGDVDGDNNKDVIISGITGIFLEETPVTQLYLNDDASFRKKDPGPAWPMDEFNGDVALEDLDGDGDLDVFMNLLQQGEIFVKTYENDGNGNFSEISNNAIQGTLMIGMSFDFADVDGDNDLDLIITGNTEIDQDAYITKLYLNDGNGKFSADTKNNFQGLLNGASKFADIDGDNDQDLYLTGKLESDEYMAELFLNDGSGVFIPTSSTAFTGIVQGDIGFYDADGDNDKDLLVTGRNSIATRIAILYINDGNGNFNEKPDVPFEGVIFGSVAFADIDNDNDQDVLITGKTNDNSEIAKLYINSGNGNYSEAPNLPFDGVSSGSGVILDIDNDNDGDVLITGINGINPITKLYRFQ